MGDHTGFTVVLRGYDRAEVNAIMRRIEEGQASADPAVRAAVRDELNRCRFQIRVRGYDRPQVDDYLRQAIDRLA